MTRKLNERHFCGWCGGKVTYRSQWMTECSNCGYKNYTNPIPCMNLMIESNNKILFVRRAIDPQKGHLDLPGGFVDMADETIEETCYREANEELGLTQSDLAPLRYEGSGTSSYTWMDTELRNLCFFFSTQLLTNPDLIRLDTSENSEIIWFNLNEIESIDYAWDIDKDMLARYAKRKKEK